MVTTGEFLVLGLILLLSVLLWAFVLKPLKARIQGLPSKEDLSELRRALEGERTPAAEGGLSAKERGLGFSPGRGGLEVEIYKEIWPRLVDLNHCLLEMKPLLDSKGRECSDPECRRKFIEEFRRSLESLQEVVLKNKPFYDDAVFEALQELTRQVQAKALIFHLGERPMNEAAWARNKAHLEEIGKKIEKVCETIRGRVFS